MSEEHKKLVELKNRGSLSEEQEKLLALADMGYYVEDAKIAMEKCTYIEWYKLFLCLAAICHTIKLYWAFKLTAWSVRFLTFPFLNLSFFLGVGVMMQIWTYQFTVFFTRVVGWVLKVMGEIRSQKIVHHNRSLKDR